MAITLPELKYELKDLEPFLSETAMDLHYNKHLKTYINNINTLILNTEFFDKSLENIVLTSIGPIFNNAAQAYNHAFYFSCLKPNTNQENTPPKNINNLIELNFGTFENFKNEFIQSAVNNFGSGWTWLVQDEKTNKLSIVNTSNANTPIVDGLNLLLCVDVWEHAYYTDYQNRRKDFVEKFFEYINWDFVEGNLK
jgi:Fe-Mn family superoxide dismutase